MIASDRLAWHEEARCLGADPNIFFPERGESNAPAKAICQACDVRVECLEEALITRDIGIQGGTSERERKYIRRRGFTAGEYITGLENGTITAPRRGRFPTTT